MHSAHALATAVTDLLYVAPALVLLAWLWLTRRYPGERLLARLVARRRVRSAHQELLAQRPRWEFVRLLRSGRMLGSWLAVRPPPVPVAS